VNRLKIRIEKDFIFNLHWGTNRLFKAAQAKDVVSSVRRIKLTRIKQDAIFRPEDVKGIAYFL